MLRRQCYKITSEFDFSIYKEALDTRISYTIHDENEQTLDTKMRKKFGSMSSVSETGGKKSITVITREALSSYWANPMTLDHELSVSLSPSEVVFIIYDSFRIYGEYDEIILTEYFDPALSSSPYAWNIPILQGDIIYPTNLLMIAVNVVAMNRSPFIGLSLAMLCLVIGIAFIWMLPVGQENEENKTFKNKTHGSIKNPLILLCLFVFIITINSGLMYQVINPAFEHLTGLVSWYWAVPYIVALAIVRNLPMKANR
jgi:hypothetical protein